MQVRHALLVSAALVVGDVRDASACTCPSYAFELPAIGATGVPTNVRQLYFSAAGTTDVRLQSVSGEQVPIDVREVAGYRGRLATASVSAELQPETHYTVWQGPLGASTMLLDFTTGSGPDLVAPPQPRFESFHIDYDDNADNSSSCGRDTFDIEGHIAAQPDADIATVVLRFTDSDGNIEERILPPALTGTLEATGETVWRPGILGPTACAISLKLGEDTYRVEAWAIDAAGNTSELATRTVDVDGGCTTTRPTTFGAVLAVLVLAARRRRRSRSS